MSKYLLWTVPALGAALVLSLAGASATPAVAQDLSQSPLYGVINLSAGFPNDPRTVNVTAGGSINVGQTIGGSCNGNIANAPDVRVNYNSGALPLNFYVTSNADTTLVVNAPDGRWYCNDDFQGLDPAVLFGRPMSGQYDIWIGTFGQGTSPATLHVTEFEPFNSFGTTPSGAQPAGQRPNTALAPTYGSLRLSAGFPDDPRRQGLTAGGTINAAQSNIGGNCTGFVATAPDFRVHYTAGSLPLAFFVTSNSDTTLVINDPNGRWHCNDDYQGLDPAVQFNNPATGQYDIWVGTFGSQSNSATLYMTEFEPFTQY